MSQWVEIAIILFGVSALLFVLLCRETRSAELSGEGDLDEWVETSFQPRRADAFRPASADRACSHCRYRDSFEAECG